MRFHENYFPLKAFPQNTFHKMQEKHDEEKSKEASVAHYFYGEYCTETATWYFIGLADK